MQAILQAPKLTNKTALPAFLELLAFYDRFLETRATVAAELYKLARYDETKPLVLSADVSLYGINATLTQENEVGREAPIAFAMLALGPAKKVTFSSTVA